jgi:hypothetical protein
MRGIKIQESKGTGGQGTADGSSGEWTAGLKATGASQEPLWNGVRRRRKQRGEQANGFAAERCSEDCRCKERGGISRGEVRPNGMWGSNLASTGCRQNGERPECLDSTEVAVELSSSKTGTSMRDCAGSTRQSLVSSLAKHEAHSSILQDESFRFIELDNCERKLPQTFHNTLGPLDQGGRLRDFERDSGVIQKPSLFEPSASGAAPATEEHQPDSFSQQHSRDTECPSQDALRVAGVPLPTMNAAVSPRSLECLLDRNCVDADGECSESGEFYDTEDRCTKMECGSSSREAKRRTTKVSENCQECQTVIEGRADELGSTVNGLEARSAPLSRHDSPCVQAGGPHRKAVRDSGRDSRKGPETGRHASSVMTVDLLSEADGKYALGVAAEYICQDAQAHKPQGRTNGVCGRRVSEDAGTGPVGAGLAPGTGRRVEEGDIDKALAATGKSSRI